MIDYQKQGELHLVTMDDGPNTICPDWQQRIMREDRGWFCVSEVDVGVPVPQPMADALVGEAG